MGYNSCKNCKSRISRYSIDRIVDTGFGDGVRTYYFKFCWACGYFSIYPNILDEFTRAVMNNKMMIIELIDQKKLKPIL